MSDYSRGDYADLPAGTTDLENNYSAPDLTAIASNDNSTYAEQTANNEIAIHQYKKTITSQYTNILWSGKSSLAPSESPVILEVYNVTGTPAWEELDRDDSTAADTDFDLSYDNLATADYLDSGVITWRVYQAASVGPQNYTVTATAHTTLPMGRTLVKTSGGVLYCVYSNNDRVRVSKFESGAWTSGVAMETESFPVAVAINSSDDIGILYTDTALNYVLFDESGQSFGTPVQVSTMTNLNQGWQWYGLVFDSSDKAHAVWADHPSSYVCKYSNNVSGWLATPITVATSTYIAYPSITIDKSATPGYPVISFGYETGGNYGLAASIGDANNPSTFGTPTFLENLAGTIETSVAVDSAGDISIAYLAWIAGVYDLKVIKHDHTANWTTWGTADTLSSPCLNPNIAINGTDRYVLAENTTTGKLVVFTDTGTWDAGTDIQTGGINGKFRWSPYNNPSYASSGIEYTFEDGSNNLIQSTVYT